MIRVLALFLLVNSVIAEASPLDWMSQRAAGAYGAVKQKLTKIFVETRELPMVAIYPCGVGCVRVGDEELAMTPESGTLGPAQILASARTADDTTYLLRIPRKVGHLLAVFVKSGVGGRVVAYSDDELDAPHASAAQLAALVRNKDFLNYLLAPVRAEARFRKILAGQWDMPLALASDVRALSEARVYDAQIQGKIQRLQSFLNAKFEEPAILRQVRRVENQINFALFPVML